MERAGERFRGGPEDMTISTQLSASTPAATQRDRMVLQHLSLVSALAAHIQRRLPMAVDPNDLFQAGAVGLLDAVASYDSSKELAFDRYARQCIRGTIFASLRQSQGTPRNPRRHEKRTTANGTYVAAQFPSREGAAAGQSWTAPSQLAAGPESRPDRICERNELRLTLARAIGRLPKRYRNVLSLHYDSDMTLKKISGLLGVSVGRVSQMRRKALQRVSADLQTRGFTPDVHFTTAPERERPAAGDVRISCKRVHVRSGLFSQPLN
jgi:RNA polymerase sigma factor FliA